MYDDVMELHSKTRTGRGAVRDLPNRFEKLAMDLDPDVVQGRSGCGRRGVAESKTIFLDDQSESIIVKNESPDVGFGAGIESISWVRAWLRLLLCAALSRVSWFFRGARFRNEDHGETPRGGIVAA